MLTGKRMLDDICISATLTVVADHSKHGPKFSNILSYLVRFTPEYNYSLLIPEFVCYAMDL